MPKISLAITGTIGSGKSTVSNIIRKYNLTVYDADVESKKILAKNGPGYLKCLELFPEVSDPDGNIDRQKLAQIIFNDEEKKLQLEALIHPFIKADIIASIANKDLFIAEIPLLFEKHFDKFFINKLLVTADDDVINKRLLARGMTQSEIDARIANQLSVEEKSKLATHVIKNNQDLTSLEDQVVQYLHLIKIL